MATPVHTTAHSTCPYCGVGCGIVASCQEDSVADTHRQSRIIGDTSHPANVGRLCVKGSALGETLGLQGRLLQPFVDGMPSDWPHAMQNAASRLKQIIAKHGPSSVAMYLSGQLLTEDYYVANKLLKGFIGSAHLDTNSRLCMASTVVGHKRAFGEDVVPACYEDLEQTDLLVLVGSNLAWAHPVLFQRWQAAKANHPQKKLVVIDPRRTATADSADLHLALKPGCDVALFVGLLQFMASRKLLDEQYCQQYCQGVDAAIEASLCWQDVAQLAAYCDVPVDALQQFFSWFAGTPRTVTVFSQGVNQAQNGSDKVNAILNLHLATGRIGKVGAGPLSVTGQPNAMGGREVGALANQLAGHLRFPGDFDKTEANPEAEWQALQQFWQAPALVRQGGYTAVDLFAAVGRGEIKAIWIMATNPVVSMPQADLVKAALQQCELVIVSDIYQDTDTVALADIVFPALGFAEKDGTVTNSERSISRQRAFLAPPGQAKADWQIICDLAKHMGFEHGFAFEHPAQIFREHAAVTALCNGGRRALDLSAVTRISDHDYQQWQPVQWPLSTTTAASPRLFSQGGFYTSSGRAQLLPLTGLVAPSVSTESGSFVLNSGRLRDQWHTMTRTGKVPGLMQHQAEPFVAIHPEDAQARQIADGDLVELTNSQGRYRARAQLTDAQRRGELFVPMHWTEQLASMARCDVLYDASRDPFSKQPAFKQGQVQLRRLAVTVEILLFSSHRDWLPLLTPYCHDVVALPHPNMHEYRLALTVPLSAIPAQLRGLLQLLQAHHGEGQLLEVAAPNQWRYGLLSDDRLHAVLYAAERRVPVDRSWLDQAFASALSAQTRREVLRGSPAQGGDVSPLVCSCFQVRTQPVLQAIAQGARCKDSLGAALQCGTGCGSCVPELQQLLKQASLIGTSAVSA